MTKQSKGKLIIVGGHENKDGDPKILEFVAKEVKRLRGTLVITTVATNLPDELTNTYLPVFRDLGIHSDRIDVLDIRSREEAYQEETLRKLEHAKVIFFTGGDQLRITSQIGDSPIYRRLQELFTDGGTIVGTSAGAAVLPETMLVSGPSDESSEVSALGMAPGLGLIHGVVIDSHFAQRGRMGRLLGAVAQNPKNLGLGIDEDTAIIVEYGKHLRVLGSGAVYVVDGSGITYSSLSEKYPEGIISIHDVKLHVLGEDDCFDLVNRRPEQQLMSEEA
jgi:cyanophycinase